MFDRILKMEKGKPTKRCSEIVKRHVSGLQLPITLVNTLEIGKRWKVNSATKPTSYSVEKIDACSAW